MIYGSSEGNLTCNLITKLNVHNTIHVMKNSVVKYADINTNFWKTGFYETAVNSGANYSTIV